MCSSINLRTQDITTINGQVKSWMFQDCLEKPSELALYRKPENGGLGLFNVKLRDLSLMIRTFLERATNEMLYHVLGEESLSNPGFPPYYDMEFFKVIQHYHLTSPLNISKMTINDWYRALLEDKLMMKQPSQHSPATLIPTRAETLFLETDWPEIWRRARICGL